MPTINVTPIVQIGNNCKIIAIATIEQYYASLLGFTPIPLHKRKNSSISIRELAKKNGSVQGEVLEIQQLKKTLSDIGYQSTIIDFTDNYQLFERTIQKNLAAGHLIISFFAVNTETANPSELFNENEHAAVITDLNKSSMEFLHWGQKRRTHALSFFKSSTVLPLRRMPEYYDNIKGYDKIRKYELSRIQNDSALKTPHTIKSIIPDENSGFHCKLLIVQKPDLNNIQASRAKFMASKINSVLNDALLELEGVAKSWGNITGINSIHQREAGQLILRFTASYRTFLSRNKKPTTQELIDFKKKIIEDMKQLEQYKEILFPLFLNIIAMVTLIIPLIKWLITGTPFFKNNAPGEEQYNVLLNAVTSVSTRG